MNPETNRFERLTAKDFTDSITSTNLVRPDGTPVPPTWIKFQVGELVTIKDYTFKVAYIGETTLLLEPVGPSGVQGLLEGLVATLEATPKVRP